MGQDALLCADVRVVLALMLCLQGELMVATNLFSVAGNPATMSRITLAFMQVGVCFMVTCIALQSTSVCCTSRVRCELCLAQNSMAIHPVCCTVPFM